MSLAFSSTPLFPSRPCQASRRMTTVHSTMGELGEHRPCPRTQILVVKLSPGSLASVPNHEVLGVPRVYLTWGNYPQFAFLHTCLGDWYSKPTIVAACTRIRPSSSRFHSSVLFICPSTTRYQVTLQGTCRSIKADFTIFPGLNVEAKSRLSPLEFPAYPWNQQLSGQRVGQEEWSRNIRMEPCIWGVPYPVNKTRASLRS